jgi:hypothetical protein
LETVTTETDIAIATVGLRRRGGRRGVVSVGATRGAFRVTFTEDAGAITTDGGVVGCHDGDGSIAGHGVCCIGFAAIFFA